MDIDPNQERLISIVFLVLNAVSIILFHQKIGSPEAVGLATILTITSVFLLLSHETDFQSVRLLCSVLPLAVSVFIPRRKGLERYLEAILMAAPVSFFCYICFRQTNKSHATW